MFEKLFELVGKLSNEQQSEFKAELEKLKTSTIAKPNSLEEMLKNSELASLVDKRVGELRTKWENETKEKTEKEKLESLKDAPQKTEISQLIELMQKQNEAINQKFEALSQEKNVSSLQSYANDKIAEFQINDKFKDAIVISSNTTKEDVDKLIDTFKNIQVETLKTVNNTPSQPNIEPDKVNSEVMDVIDEMFPTEQN